MKIEILGTGCSKCQALTLHVKEAVAKKGIFAQVEKVEDIMQIMNYGVTSTPALVVDGKVLSSGKLLSVDEIVTLLG
ncbi:thioredoxin family protein [Sulfurospirillum multivorans]|uniref:Redox-active disulfide protein 2 n=2 Tax=Sulfurospirillum multivorans TaxID=66821 RepID=A0AA86DZF8_SULMK|nr:thioredoxin family protein [Sulfurospirillum multivorans]AHJ14333.1 redox-active disulfide protein 2 [Sulfurospirillum multivorans DSM 12446]QEH07819.1 redox-active disulfide protein 2 [Sulfurospirillum multivorans]